MASQLNNLYQITAPARAVARNVRVGGAGRLVFGFLSERKLHTPKYSGVRIASLSRDRNPATWGKTYARLHREGP